MRRKKELGSGFTLVELLVVIGVVAVLAGLLMPVISQARRNANVTTCQSNLRGLSQALVMYQINEGGGRYYVPWITYLGDPRRHPNHLDASGESDYEEALAESAAPGYIDDPNAFVCPADPTAGEEGNRDSTWRWGGAASDQSEFDEFQNPDVDWHEHWDFTADNTEHDKVPCSYLYEFCAEICEWAHVTIDDYNTVPLSSPNDADESRAPELEWLKRIGPDRWIKSDYPDVPDVDDFMRVADTNHDGKISWGEMKMMNVKGRSVTKKEAFGSTTRYRLPAMEGKMPLIRCFWHVDGPAVDRDSRKILNVNAGGHISQGYFMWQRDLEMYD